MIIDNNSNNKNNFPSVAVVILNWNGVHFLQKYIPSVVASTYRNLKIIIADNASTDDSVAFLETTYPSIEIIKNKQNEGYAKGYNTALKNVVADYYILLNSDVEVTPNWLEPMINLMETDKNIGACQPKILDEQNKTQFEYAGASGGWIDKYGYPFARGRVLETLEKDEEQYNDATPCFWATGAALCVRAKVYRSLAGLDEYFFAHQEEIDLCWRMQLSGYSVYVQPASVVYHVGGGTLKKGSNKKTYLNFRNNLIMLYKNTNTLNLVRLLPIRFLLDALAAYKYLFSGNIGFFIAVAKAHLHFLYWIMFHQKKSLFVKQKSKIINGKYNGSILWQYYIKNKKMFSEIVSNN